MKNKKNVNKGKRSSSSKKCVDKEKIENTTEFLNEETRKCALSNLLLAVARLDAAFPAGDYHLNTMQNKSLNGLNDAVCRYKLYDGEFREMVDKAYAEHEREQLETLWRKGLISEEELEMIIDGRNLG